MNKLGKIAPIVAIVACLGSLFFVFKLSGQKKGMQEQIAGLTSDKQQLETTLASTKRDLSTTRTALASTTDELTNTAANLTATQAKLAEKTQEADGLKTQLDVATKDLGQVKSERDAAQTNIKQIQNSLGITNIQDTGQLAVSIVARAEENKILGKQLLVMRDENLALKQKVEELSTTPSNLRGRVAAVQDNWGFVVLDIGRTQHVTANAQFVVYRDSKMIGKVQVLSVGQDTCVAEILPEFQHGAPRVGDTVVH
jgi:hypothetical protein